MEEWSYIFLLLTFLHLPHTTDLCLYNCCNCGEVSPPNVYISLGSTLELNCTIEKDDSTYSLMFVFNKKKVDPPESSEIQNNSIVLKRVIHSVEEGGDYSCYKNDKKVGSSTVEVEYPLQNLKDSDFVCELFDWDKYLSCVWKIGTYKRESNIDVAIVAETMGSPFISENTDRNHPVLLPKQMNRTYAFWNTSLGQPYIIKFHLKITQTRTNETLRQTLTRKVKDIVKPAPISKIFAESISSTSLALRWENSHQDNFQIYNIHLSDEWNSYNYSESLFKLNARRQELNFTDLIPFTEYSVTIIRRPFEIKMRNLYVPTGHWSSPTAETFKTLPDEPVSPPIIIEGSFSRVGEQEVVFYWKPIKPMDRRGNISYYTVEYASLNDSTKGSNFSQHENLSLPLDSNKWYNISLFAVTFEGLKSPSNFEIVPPKTEGPQISSTVIEVSRNRTQALVHWEPNSECLYYVVFWIADTKLDWKTSTQNDTTLSIQNISSFQVGISCSLNLSRSSLKEPMVVGGGIWWSKCKYPEEKDPALPSSLTLTPDKAALDVTWTLVCDGLSSYPQWFNLTWCDLHPSQEVCQDKYSVLLDPRERYYRLEDLDPKKTYRVRINSLSKENRLKINMDYEDQTPEIYEYIKDNAAMSLILPLTIIFSIIAVVIMGFIYIAKKCRSEKDVAVEVPFVPHKDAKEDTSYNTKNRKFMELTDKRDDQIVDNSQFSDLEKDSTGTKSNDIQLGLKEEQVVDSAYSEVPCILEAMMLEDKVKKPQKTPQSSDYSKFIVASGHTNNSDLFNQSQSQSSSHGNQTLSVLSSDDVDQSKSPTLLSTDLSQSEQLSNQPWSGMQKKRVTSSSSSTSDDDDDDDDSDDHDNYAYQGIGHFDDSSSTDTSAYPPSQSVPYSSSAFTEPDMDSYSKAKVNEDISAGTDDELLVSSEETASSGCGIDSMEHVPIPPQSLIHSANIQQVPSDAVLTSSPGVSNTPVHQSSANSPSPPHIGNPTDSLTTSEDTGGHPTSTSGASLASSTSDYNEGGYKAVDLDSSWTSSIQSSAYQ